MHAYVRAGSRRLNAQAASAKFARAFTLPAFLGGRRSNLEPYTVLVTGCSSGIGQATALALDAAGCTVLAGIRDTSELDAAADRWRGVASSRLRPILLDVTNEQHVRGLPEVLEAAAKGGRVGVVCNAGVARPGALECQPESEIRDMFDVNVFGVISVTRALLPIIRSTQGRVVLVGSTLGIVTLPYFSMYSATKYAVEALADGLRREVGPLGVGVSLIQPDGLRKHWREQQEGGKGGDPPEVVAETIVDAILSPDPKHRYRPGKSAAYMVRASWLHSSLADRIFK
eukprot:tig00020563_g11297.t1